MSNKDGGIIYNITNYLRSLTNIELRPMMLLYIFLTLIVFSGLIYIYNTYISKLDPNYKPNLEFNLLYATPPGIFFKSFSLK